jgi:AAA+ ATPase superfamily predicted ATPase
MQVADFTRRFATSIGEMPPAVDDWEGAMRFLLAKTDRKCKFVLAVDEFPYLIEGDKAALSTWQYLWDRILSKENVMLILLGSSISMMEEKVLGAKSPLYGRRTGQLRLGRLPFCAMTELFPRWSATDRIRAYAMLDGIPAYLQRFDAKLDLWANVEARFLDRTEPFYEEPWILIKEELREPATYAIILEAIAAGNRRLSDIANVAGVPAANITKYLRTLATLGFVERVWSVTNKRPKSRDTLYRIGDLFLNFWFTFIAPMRAEIESGNTAPALTRIRDDLDAYVGRNLFEQLSRDALSAMNRAGGLPFVAERIGSWWLSDAEIDVVALNERTKDILFVECKWSARPVDRDVLIKLREVSRLVEWNRGRRREHFGVVARSGFTERAKAYADEQKMHLWDLGLLDSLRDG